MQNYFVQKKNTGNSSNKVLIEVAYYKHYFLFNNFKIGFSKSKLCKEKLIDVDENS